MAKKKRTTKYDRTIAAASKRFGNGNGKKPGEKAREQQLADVQSDRRMYESEADTPITGNVSTRRAVSRAKSALKRQQRLRQTKGKSAY